MFNWMFIHSFQNGVTTEETDGIPADTRRAVAESQWRKTVAFIIAVLRRIARIENLRLLQTENMDAHQLQITLQKKEPLRLGKSNSKKKFCRYLFFLRINIDSCCRLEIIRKFRFCYKRKGESAQPIHKGFIRSIERHNWQKPKSGCIEPTSKIGAFLLIRCSDSKLLNQSVPHMLSCERRNEIFVQPSAFEEFAHSFKSYARPSIGLGRHPVGEEPRDIKAGW
mmetsp:Transcript_19487/g.51826  ORF Transcript_19487/g.51826 Transcript_19487/m.51826 type:complete len:224 (-) Transcript_19487:1100-1771(-)